MLCLFYIILKETVILKIGLVLILYVKKWNLRKVNFSMVTQVEVFGGHDLNPDL